jgi:tryptophanyl-tRNA synthetase
MTNTTEKENPIVLTGITPSGTPHLGNYIGAIKPALEMAKNPNYHARYFIADYHSLVKLWDAKLRKQYTTEIAATWLALGLNPEHTIFYRQSDVPEIMELTWILTSLAAKGLLNRAHAYKAQVDLNSEDETKDPDAGITMGLFNYPVLMAADIIMFDTDYVPVGKDQIQHVEIARDIANRFNHVYKTNCLVAPEAMVDDKAKTIPGLDGRKMSKSYGNTIPIFENSKKLRKLIMKIKTNSQLPEEPKDPTNCNVFSLYEHFATQDEIQALKKRYEEGIGWGEAKQALFEKVDEALTAPREIYQDLIANPEKIEVALSKGAEQARDIAAAKLKEIRKLIGIT